MTQHQLRLTRPGTRGLRERLVREAVDRRLAWLAWPVVLEHALFTLVSLADVYIVGQLGAAALAGVGLASQTMLVPGAVVSAVGVGTTALVARHTGAREGDQARRLAAQGLLLGAGLAILFGLVGLAFAPGLLGLYGADTEATANGATWLRLVAATFGWRGVMVACSAALRGAGDTRTPLVVHVLTSLLNVTVAWTLTQGAFGLPRLGVQGNALGAAGEQLVAGLALLTILLKRRSPIQLRLDLVRPHVFSLRRVLRIGLPAGAEQILFQVALAALTGIIARLGTEAFAAHQVSLRVSFLASLPGWGFNVAATTLVGQALGRRRADRARQYTNAAYRLCLGFMSAIGLGLLLSGRSLLGLFVAEPAVVEAGHSALVAAVLILPIMAGWYAYAGALAGAGDTPFLLLISVVSTWLVRLSVSYLASALLGLGLLGIWLGIGADYASRTLWSWLRYRSGRWVHRQV